MLPCNLALALLQSVRVIFFQRPTLPNATPSIYSFKLIAHNISEDCCTAFQEQSQSELGDLDDGRLRTFATTYPNVRRAAKALNTPILGVEL
jgi:hypothetical protein